VRECHGLLHLCKRFNLQGLNLLIEIILCTCLSLTNSRNPLFEKSNRNTLYWEQAVLKTRRTTSYTNTI